MDFMMFTDHDGGDNATLDNVLLPALLPKHDEDHVRWQSSQKCEVLNHLLTSTEFRFEGPGSSRPVREPYNRMGSHNSATSGAPQQSLDTSEPSSKSFRRNSARLRYTGSGPSSPQSAPKALPSDLVSPMPFFDKKNPSRFFAVLKGVSARVDEKAGVTKRQIAGSPDYPTSARCHKKRRPVSLGDVPEAKKGRVDAFRGEARLHDMVAEDKGKARARDSDQDVSLNLQSHRSMPNVTPFQSTGVKDPPYCSDDTSMDVNALPEASFTPSQTAMPPPAGLTKEYPICSPNVISMHRTLPNAQQNPGVKKAKTDAVPQLHPLILQNQNSSSKPTCAKALIHPKSHSRSLETCVTVKEDRSRPPLASSLEAVQIKSRARPPQLGMRRAHTVPGQSIQIDRGSLPTTQRRFKPPYPQKLALAPLEEMSSSRMSQGQDTKSSSLRSHTCTAGSSSSESMSSIGSSCTIDSHPATVDQATPPLCELAADDSLTKSPHDDPDSSFGDMSFDMAALEETMRKYD